MESWTERGDAPYLRREEPSSAAWIWVLFFVLLAGGAALFYYLTDKPEPAQPPVTAAAPEDMPEPAAPPAAAEPQLRFPEAPPQEAPRAQAPALPSLDNSDAMMRDTIVGLVGRKPFEELVYPAELVRRIVATVDNLPRETAPQRVMPVQAVPGVLGVTQNGDDAVLDVKSNAARYAPYVSVFQMLDARALVERYVASYPLFQRAYQELGFPDGYFNDRLLAAIDNLLTAPEIDGPIALERPKVLYQFADPGLEQRSAGQKIMIRMGPENAAKVKAKLREIRRELIAAASRTR